jgi:hypothetical protein
LDQIRDSFPATAKLFSLTIIEHLRDGLLNAVTVPRRDTCVVTIDCECDPGQPGSRRMSGSGRPMIDAANGRISESGLKALRILPQVMQQPGQLRLVSEAQRFTESASKRSHLAQVVSQSLPPTRVRIRATICKGGCMGVVIHGPVRIEVSSKTHLPWVYLREIISGRVGQKLS